MAPKPNRTQIRRKATRERIFRSAMELFEQKGFENTTVEEITQAADIGKGTFFTYFPTKEAVFRVLGELTLGKMNEISEKGLNQNEPVGKILREILTVSADWHTQHKFITLQMTQTNSAFSFDLDRSNKAGLLHLLNQLVAEGQTRGEFSSERDSMDVATVLAGMYFAVLALWASSENTLLEERLNAAMVIVFNGITLR